MFQTPGPITDRLLHDPGLTLDGWYPDRDAALRTETRPVAAGYRVGARRRSGRRTFWLDFTATLVNICFPSMALWLVLGVTQAASLGYLR